MSELVKDWLAGLTLQAIAEKHGMTVIEVTKSLKKEWGTL